MGFVRNLIRKSVELDMLDRQIALLEGQITKLSFERDANAKQVIAERNKRDKDNVRFNQTLTKLAGGNPNVFNEQPPLQEPPEPELTERQLEGIRHLAQQMLDNDVLNGDSPLPLADYERMIVAKGDEYLPIIVE